jgi:hypothetical protein
MTWRQEKIGKSGIGGLLFRDKRLGLLPLPLVECIDLRAWPFSMGKT